jgi:mono/diheme cytochrome c family protein
MTCTVKKGAQPKAILDWGCKFARLLAITMIAGARAFAVDPPGATEFHKEIQPILTEYCSDCHADGAKKGGFAFDAFPNDEAVLGDRGTWLHVLKNLRAGLMPPQKKDQPTEEQKERVEHWIKQAVFEADPENPDPGRVTIRRLNRVEYHNTIRDLLGVDFDTDSAFPPDDTGNGFDNIGDVLTLPPMLLEKYVVAANQIVTEAVPMVMRIMPETIVAGRQFRGSNQPPAADRGGRFQPRGLSLSYYQPAAVSNVFNAAFSGKYQLAVSLMVNEKFVDNIFDYNKCRLIFRVDGKELMREDYSWEGGKPYHYNYEADWQAGSHELAFELQPLTTNEQTRTLSMQITSVKVSGPMAQEHWVTPKDYAKFFPKKVPTEAPGRRAYARELLGEFARRAFRRPPEEKTLDRLVKLAESIYSQPNKTFEAGVAQGMVAILSSPRFLFLEEQAEKPASAGGYALIDEFSLASRLSYFLWSTMPDEQSFQLAQAGQLRNNLNAQVQRMLKDPRSGAFVKDFVGQWLRTRDIDTIPIEARFVLSREEKFNPDAARNRQRFRELNDKPGQLTPEERDEMAKMRETFRRFNRQLPRADLSGPLRSAMRAETEQYFDYVLREDRSLLELLDSDYTFLNERLAQHYGITNVIGDDMRLVKLPANSPRGGILTQGSVLAVTSNPTRTSPVKRGVFILDNILGTPPPPPPPNIPQLEDAAKDLTNRAPSLRETLAMHRQNALCSSCHNRMDPLGLAMENFNAMGMWRDQEFGDPIDATGMLITGERFNNIQELKHILVTKHSRDFYTTVTEKLLIYALGRGLDYYDVETVDQIVARIKKADGRVSALIAGVVESAPFQKTRLSDENKPVKKGEPGLQAAAETKP